MGLLNREHEGRQHWYLYLEPTGKKEKTDILYGKTRQERKAQKEKARQHYLARLNELGDEKRGLGTPKAKPAIAITDFAQWFRDNVVVHHGGAERERDILKHILRFCAVKHLTALTQITTETLKEYETWRTTVPYVIAHFGGPNGKPRTMPPPKPVTINRETAVLKQMLVAAVPTYLEKSPLEDAPFLDCVDAVPRLMSDAERERLLGALDTPWDRAIFLIGYEGLVRLTNILDFKKTDREYGAAGHQWLCVREPKNNRPYKIKLSKVIITALDALPPNATEYLFPQRRGAELERNRRGAFATMLRRAAARAHVPWGRKRGGNVFHWATRTTGATRMVDQGGEGVLKAVAQMGGWKNTFMLEKTYHLVKATDLDAIVDRLNTDNAQKAKRARQDAAKAAKTGQGRGKAAKPAARVLRAKRRFHSPTVPQRTQVG